MKSSALLALLLSSGLCVYAQTTQPATQPTTRIPQRTQTPQFQYVPVPSDTPGAPVYLEVPITATNTNNANPTTVLPRSTIEVPSLARTKVSPIQLTNISRIEVALNGLELPPRSGAEPRQHLLEALQAAPIPSIKPSSDSISKLVNSLAAVVPGLDLTAPQRRQLAIDLNMALNSATLNSVESHRVMDDFRGLLQPSAAKNPDGVKELEGNVSSIVSKIQSQVAQSGNQSETSQTNQVGNVSTRTSQPSAVGQSAPSQSGSGQGKDR